VPLISRLSLSFFQKIGRLVLWEDLTIPELQFTETQAWFCALRLDFAGAFQYHPLFWILPVGIALFLYWNKIPKKIQKILLAAACILFLAVYIWRMLDPSDTIVVFHPENGAIFSLISNLFTKK